MKIIRRIVYVVVILLVFIAFVFFGGGGVLVKVGESMEKWELSMKKSIGGFCKQGEKRLKSKAGKVAKKLPSSKDLTN
ncbi:MAG: hypothetical protein ACMUIS_00190 [bacterium]